MLQFSFQPLVKQVRSGLNIHKIVVSTLENLISEVNDCELYARVHKQTDHLDSSFIIDIGERLPFYFKGRYADYLQDRFRHLSRLRNSELWRIHSAFSQRFLGLSETRSPTKLRVNQTNVDVKTNSVTHKPSSLKQHQKYRSTT